MIIYLFRNKESRLVDWTDSKERAEFIIQNETRLGHAVLHSRSEGMEEEYIIM